MKKFQLPPEYDTVELQKLVELFPQFWRESYFDFDEFKAYISGIVPDDLQEKYSFTWHGKTESYRLLKKNSHGTLRPCKEDSVNWDTTQNLYIEGDNLEVLKLIKHTYAGERGVKMIYIDPPYNTSNDFVYDDNFMDSLDKYLEYTGQNGIAMPESSGRYHTRWLNMMYPRLWLANYVLSDDGVIFISIDDNEVFNLRKMCNEVFGEENFAADISWQRTYSSRNDSKGIVVEVEHILMYSKQPNWSPNKLARTEEMDAKYSSPDGDERLWTSSSLSAPGGASHQGMVYAIQHPFSGEMMYPTVGRHWALGQDQVIENMNQWCSYELKDVGDASKRAELCGLTETTVRQNVQALVLSESLEISRQKAQAVLDRGNWPYFYFTDGGKGGIRRKTYLDEMGGRLPTNFWPFSEVGHTDEAKKELKALFDGDIPFDTPKPVRLIERILDIATDKDSVILDFFGGSATTAHAVMKKNAEDGGNRKFILVQLPEKSQSSKYDTLFDIGKERIRRAGAKIAEQNPNVDVGFRVFKLDKSNFKIWDDTPVDPKNPSEIAKLYGQLELHAESPFVEGRTHEDIVYEIMRMNNYPLTTPIIPIDINGETVYGIGEHCDFIICLDVAIDDTAAEELCTYRPGRILFTDSCFKDTKTRVNVEHTIKNINNKIKLRVV